jgi:uncharacterized membrane protein YccC
MGDSAFDRGVAWLVKQMRALQWTRGLRAGLAVALAMLVCRMLGRPMGWAALGGFEAILVDNGGAYRSRLETMATLLIGGALACVAGAMASGTFWVGMGATAAFCFAATYARVASERIASTSVIILVLYFSGFGSESHTLAYSGAAAIQFVLGGVGAAVLSLLLWPVDPFRPARTAVAECYGVLARFTAEMLDDSSPAGEAAARMSAGHFQREMRRKIEEAQRSLVTAPARVTARTVRARNLSVLLETADMLFAITMRWRELAEVASEAPSQNALRYAARWLSKAESAIAAGLEHRPADGGASYAPDGSHSVEHVQPRLMRSTGQPQRGTLLAHLATDERDALENVQIAFEAVRAVWSGLELKPMAKNFPAAAAVRYELPGEIGKPSDADTGDSSRWHFLWHYRWTDALRANWTGDSVMMRHALRMAVVGAADVVLMRLTHVRHGSWLAMTSIIVLQPYGSGTLRRGVQRVGGTIAGGILAAVLATAVHGPDSLIAIITVVSALTLATYAVNYAWYCFFLTPTFVLMTMPHAHDWRFAEVRIANTILGALVAVLAMRLLWPEREHLELGRLLGRGASADAAYLRAMVEYWQIEAAARPATERQMLAPARRRCGLAINDAEESLDRMMLEPGFGRKAASGDLQAEALAFVTYLRRLMRVATTLTAIGRGSDAAIERIAALTARLDAMAVALQRDGSALVDGVSVVSTSAIGMDSDASVEEQQMRRMERQVGVLERAAVGIQGKAFG